MKRQNISSAVMQQRKEAHDSLDDFPTPPWATRALMQHVILPVAGPVRDLRVWEPACNRGYMAGPLGEYFGTVIASDIHDYGYDAMAWCGDFLFPGSRGDQIVAAGGGADWVFSNPPFRLAEQFIQKSCGVARQGVAMFVRSAFIEGIGRYERLFSKNPPSLVAQFVERVSLVKGRIDETASSATAYSWLVWMDGECPTKFVWIPPCRKQLERAGDYPPVDELKAAVPLFEVAS